MQSTFLLDFFNCHIHNFFWYKHLSLFASWPVAKFVLYIMLVLIQLKQFGVLSFFSQSYVLFAAMDASWFVLVEAFDRGVSKSQTVIVVHQWVAVLDMGSHKANIYALFFD